MHTETIAYQDGAVSLRGFVAYDDTRSDPRPGVLVMPGGFGLGANAKHANGGRDAGRPGLCCPGRRSVRRRC